jgi:hypothetical protein
VEKAKKMEMQLIKYWKIKDLKNYLKIMNLRLIKMMNNTNFISQQQAKIYRKT